MVYSKEQKLKIIKEYLDGQFVYPPNITTQQKENIRKKIKKWVGVYQAKGEEGLEPKVKRFSYQDKKYAIERLLSGESKYQVAFSMGMYDTKRLRTWEKIYRESGFEGLRLDGNKQKYFTVRVANKTKLKQAEEEIKFLRNKIRELDIEVEYLKKLIALVNKRRESQM